MYLTIISFAGPRIDSQVSALSTPLYLESSQFQSRTTKVPTLLSFPLHIRVPRYLRVHSGIEALEGGEWRTTSSAASFLWEGPMPLPGWNMIEIDMDRSVTGAVAILTLVTRHGSYEVELPLRAGKVTRRMCWVPGGVRSISLCPINTVGNFRLKHFRLVWLTPRFAKDRLIQRLVTAHRHFRGQKHSDVSKALKQEARRGGEPWRCLALRHYDSTFVSLSSKHNYRQWIDTIESMTSKSAVSSPAITPRNVGRAKDEVFSLVLPVTKFHLQDAIASTLNSFIAQTYAQWQLDVLAVGLPPEQRHWLASFCDQDDRMRLIHCGQKDRASTLEGWHVAMGDAGRRNEWKGLIAVGGVLSPDALSVFAETVRSESDASMVYCDEDCLDDQGDRHSPNFKPEWNPDLLLSTPYLGHLALWSPTCWEEVRNSMPRLPEFSHDAVDMIHTMGLELMDLADLDPLSSVIRVPRILLHVRDDNHQLRGTESQNGEYAHLNRVQRYLERHSLAATAVKGTPLDDAVSPKKANGIVRVRWELPDPAPLVSLLVPTRDGVEILKPCVNAILAHTTYRNFELLILDNQSSCPLTLEYMRDVCERDARVRVLRWNHPFNYSGINNYGAREARGDIIGLVNNDIEPVNGEWLSEMVSQACRNDIGCVGAKLYYPNETIQHAGVILGLGSIAGHAHRFFQRHEDGFQGRLKATQNLSAVTAACLLLRRSVFEEVNGLNEEHLAVAYNDVDLCLKVREAGYRNLWTPYAELYHHESISRGADDTPKKRARWLSECEYMRTTWAEQLDNDPAYNPNLTLVHEDFSLR